MVNQVQVGNTFLPNFGAVCVEYKKKRNDPKRGRIWT